MGYFRFPASGEFEYICSTGNVNEAEADNINYSWYIDSSGRQNILWEFGAGINRQVNADTRINFYMPVYLAFTRTGDNPAVGTFYVNGAIAGVDDDSPAEGGSSSTLAIGGSIGNTNMRSSVFSSVRISPSVVSAEKIKNTYNECLAGISPFYPYLK